MIKTTVKKNTEKKEYPGKTYDEIKAMVAELNKKARGSK